MFHSAYFWLYSRFVPKYLYFEVFADSRRDSKIGAWKLRVQRKVYTLRPTYGTCFSDRIHVSTYRHVAIFSLSYLIIKNLPPGCIGLYTTS